MSWRRLGSISFLLAAIACSSPKETGPITDAPLDWGPNAARLPTLVAVLDTEPPPPALVGAAGLAADGSVLVGTDRTGPDLLAVIDTGNRLVMTFGGSGAGPGELLAPMWAARTATGFAVFDMRQLKLVMFDSAGAPLGDLRRQGSSLMTPKLVLNDSTALVLVPGPNGEFLPATMSLTTGKATILIPAADSFMSRFKDANGKPDFTHMPTIGRWLGGVVVGDGRDYQLGLYDWGGKLLRVVSRTPNDRPTRAAAEVDKMLADLNANPARRTKLTGAALARERDRLLDEKLPYFYHTTTPTIDDQGRLWILGQAGDSGYADLYGLDGFIGRMALSCPDSVAAHGRSPDTGVPSSAQPTVPPPVPEGISRSSGSKGRKVRSEK